MSKFIDYFKKPEIYEKSTNKFWDDEYISLQMLDAHLNEDIEAASRKPEFLNQSVNWIVQIASNDNYPNVLDLGCGPGLYADRLQKKGYSVTGVDFSKRSIDYAKSTNSYNTYIYQNYLDIDFDNEFDLVILIYCDYAVLSVKDREILLKKINKALKPGGKFIFDVFTKYQYEGKTETKNWYISNGSGFWRPNTHICFQTHFIYENNIRLDQYVIIDEYDNVDVYRVWDQYFSKESIITELSNNLKYNKINIYSDVSGKPYEEGSTTMCIVLEK